MLKGIDPALTPELLMVLAQMGHGDEIVLADANFTADSLAALSPQGRPVIRLPGIDVVRASKAVLSLFPLDTFVERPVAFMQVGHEPAGYLSALQREVAAMVTPVPCEAMERFAFYDRARHAFAIVQTGELQPYGNVLFKKGVIAASLQP